MSQDNININIQETNDIVNIVSSETTEVIDINVSENIEQVTLNITEEIIEVNINKVTNVAAVNSVNGLTGNVVLDIPTATSDLTNDSNFISDASYVHTDNNYTTAEKNKLSGIAAGAEVNVNADWNATTGDAVILNKPTIPATIGDMLKSTYDVDNTGVVDNAEAIKVIGRNATGSTLYKGTIIYISGSTGNRPNFVKARANGEATSAGTFGVISDDLANNTDGYALCLGYLDNLDTRTTATHPFTADTLADGDTIYLSPTTAGYITNVKPSAPDHLVYLGKVTRTSPTNGTIVYRIQNGYELEELHNVAISSIEDKQLLSYDSATSLWKNKSVTTADIASSSNKNYVTDAQVTIINNTSGTNTGDQDLSNLVVKNATITGATKTKITYDSKGLVTGGTDATTADIADSTNKRYVTDADLTTIGNQSGINTGDETATTIKSKLGITTLSGSNTGDQDLSGLVPNTRTINTKPLSSNVTLTTADIADSTDKRYVTDANLTTIANQSGTNTGDNAVNSLYSGLASSKQDTLVSGTNIKTINGSSVLGSGNLTISGGSGILGFHALLPLSSGSQTSSSMQSMTGGTGQLFTGNRLIAYPFIPAQSFTSSNLQINVTALAVGSLGKIAVYNDLNGVPDTSIFISSDLDLSTTGIKTATASISFIAGTTYWLAFHGNATISNLNSLTAPQMIPLRFISVSSLANYLYRNATYTSGTPTSFGAATYASGNIPLIYITKA